MSTIDLHKKNILVTEASGFIGSNLVKRLYEDVRDVTVIIGIDNMNDYYDVKLKERGTGRCKTLHHQSGYRISNLI